MKKGCLIGLTAACSAIVSVIVVIVALAIIGYVVDDPEGNSSTGGSSGVDKRNLSMSVEEFRKNVHKELMQLNGSELFKSLEKSYNSKIQNYEPKVADIQTLDGSDRAGDDGANIASYTIEMKIFWKNYAEQGAYTLMRRTVKRKNGRLELAQELDLVSDTVPLSKRLLMDRVNKELSNENNWVRKRVENAHGSVRVKTAYVCGCDIQTADGSDYTGQAGNNVKSYELRIMTRWDGVFHKNGFTELKFVYVRKQDSFDVLSAGIVSTNALVNAEDPNFWIAVGGALLL